MREFVCFWLYKTETTVAESLDKTSEMKILLGLLFGSSLATKFKTKISHWNTGQLYSYEVTDYTTPVLGPVCNGERDYTTGDDFAEAACKGLFVQN